MCPAPVRTLYVQAPLSGPAADEGRAMVDAVRLIVDQAGGSVLRPAEQGPHEVRAVARDPWGNTVVVYGPR